MVQLLFVRNHVQSLSVGKYYTLGLPLCSKNIFISSVVIRVDRLVLTPGGGLYFLLALPGLEPIVRTSGECLEILLTSVCSVFRFCAIVVRCFGTEMPFQKKIQ